VTAGGDQPISREGRIIVRGGFLGKPRAMRSTPAHDAGKIAVGGRRKGQPSRLGGGVPRIKKDPLRAAVISRKIKFKTTRYELLKRWVGERGERAEQHGQAHVVESSCVLGKGSAPLSLSVPGF